MHKLAVYTHALKNTAIVGWCKSKKQAYDRCLLLGEGWTYKVSKREYFRRNSEVLLACYCVWWQRGYTLINRSVPGTPLQKEVAMLKLLTKPHTEHVAQLIEVLSYDQSVSANVPGRPYGYISAK